ncbi:protease B nonderepressible form [Rhizina undulata]
MKHRATFIVSNPEATRPENFVASPDSLHIKSLPAAREDRFTLGYHDLPDEIQDLLSKCDGAGIRWSSGNPYHTIDPYSSRLPAGLHVFVTPKKEDATDSICKFLRSAFEVEDCHSLKESFTEIPGGRQLYSPVSSLSTLQAYLKHLGVCPDDNAACNDQLSALTSADYVDLNYDASFGVVTISAFFSQPGKPWSETLKLTSKQSAGSLEVGVLGKDRSFEQEGFTLAGFSYTPGESEDLEGILFSFPSRHHGSPSTYNVTPVHPTGLHPKLRLSIAPSTPPDSECTLNAYYTLPRALFIDRYQLSPSNRELLDSLDIARLVSVNGQSDLEAPDWTSTVWGSSVLVELDAAKSSEGLETELPLHLRYSEPKSDADITEIKFPWPSLFWACRSEDWQKMGRSPFDRTQLGWEHFFPENTMFYHLSPKTDAKTWGKVDVPVLGLEHAGIIKMGTVGIVFVGFIWVLLKIISSRFAAGVKGKKE